MKQTEFIEKMSGIDPKFVSEAANYRPKRSSFIKVIAIAACIATLLTTATVWGLTLQTENKSNYETICELAETENGVFSIEVLDQKEIFSDLSTDNLKQIFAAFDVIIDQNETIELSSQVNFYLDNNDVVISKDGKCSTKNCKDNNQLKLAMLISVYITNFPKAVAPYFLNSDPNRLNVVVIPFLYISFDYDEYGFENAVDYLVSCRDEDIEYGDETFIFRAYDCDLSLYKDAFNLSDPAPNLLAFARDGLSKREEFLGGTSNEEK